MAAQLDNIALTRQGYAAFASGDMTTLAELLAPDVQWVVGGENALSGTYRGRDATFGFFGRLLAATDGTFVVALRTLAEPEPGLVLALVHTTAQARGMVLDEDAVQQLEIRDGQVVSWRSYSENSRHFDALIGPVVITLADTDKPRARSH